MTNETKRLTPQQRKVLYSVFVQMASNTIEEVFGPKVASAMFSTLSEMGEMYVSEADRQLFLERAVEKVRKEVSEPTVTTRRVPRCPHCRGHRS